jgi:Rne/Rng family ribonuclease
MNKELYVSTTPHETKVGITEDDQLAEIYLERENEYTLAGSIYKGRVTRVLPGMQSAFVDIGLERDAFLYVSDFMDLEQQDEDLDEAIPAGRPAGEARPRDRAEAGPAINHEAASAESGSVADEEGQAEVSAEAPGAAAPGGARDYRGRRRRRGRRGEIGRGERGEARTGEPRTEANNQTVSEITVGESRDESRSETRTESRTEPRNEPRNEPRTESRNDRFNRGDRPGRGASESRFSRSTAGVRPGRDYDYGPPPGYQPIVLPGESISKYQRQGQPSSLPVESRPTETSAPAAIGRNFPEDEPIFAEKAAAEVAEPLHEQHEYVEHAEVDEEVQASASSPVSEIAEFRNPALAAEDFQLRDQVQSGLGTYPETEAVARKTAHEEDHLGARQVTGKDPSEITSKVTGGASISELHETVEEQEIEEEEVDLTSYGEEPGDDEGFEELEEETRAAGGELSGTGIVEVARGLAASGEPAIGEAAIGEPMIGGAATNVEAVPEAALEAQVEAEEREAEELELEEAQAEAEALLEAEAIGEGTVDASAVVRGPAPEAMLLQRTQRRGPERGFDRGRGRRGGRRFRSRENTVVPQISELLKEGQEVLIQIAKEPIGKKGARITSHIALPGRFLVFMPTVNHTGVSRKIASEEERQRLKRIIQSERENGGGGFIVRTAAAGATDEELRADIRFLKNLWSEIKSRSDSSKSPALIYHDLNVVERVLRDQVSSEFSAIWVDTEQEYERIVRFANRFQPGLVKRVKLYTKETPLYDQFGLNEEISKALKSKVWLKSGGYIVINQTEALVAIDVNTGKYVGKTARLEDTIVKTNVDAIKEIVRQVRLRDLGGIIIIDFIDMDERRNRQKVMQALEEALRFDRAPSKVLQFNDFGLVAITRKRVKQSLERTIGSPCPYCQATGFVKSVSTICNEVYVEMRKISNHLEHSDVMLRVNPEVAKALKANNAKLLNEMEELTKKTIIVKSDPALHQEQFDIH